MKNSTIAFLLYIISMIGYFLLKESYFFIGACIFISTYLIINQIKESYKK